MYPSWILLRDLLPEILVKIRLNGFNVTLISPVTKRGKRLTVTGKHLEQPVMDLIGYLQAKEILNLIHERNMPLIPPVQTEIRVKDGTPLAQIKAVRSTANKPQHGHVSLEYHPDWIPDPPKSKSYGVCCIACDTEIQTVVNTIRARVLKGTIRQIKDGLPDPTTGLPRQEITYIPTYETGRLCQTCRSTMRATGAIKKDDELVYSSPHNGEFEYLPESTKRHKHHVVTAGAIKADHIIERKERDVPAFWDLGDILVKAPPEAPEPVHSQGFNKYALNRRGGLRNKAHSSYDEAFNKDNSSVTK